MAYTPNIWVDREGTTRYFETVEKDGAKIFTPDYSQLTEIGTPVNADNMNHIEEGIAAGSFTKYDSNTVYQFNDLVTSFEGSELKVYKSLKSENYNNPVTDTTYWEEVALGGGGSGFNLFDTKVSDHVLEGEEALGWALQGTYVYKEGVAGSRTGYADFYNKCLAEKELGTATETTLGDSTITMYVNGNGHKFYDIADKDVVDTWYNTYGIADYYGIDLVNERIFLPRNKYFAVTGGVMGNGMTVGLTNGVDNAGLYGETGGSNLSAKVGVYGDPIYTADSTTTHAIQSIGLTTDPTKSGIELEPNTDKYLYYCVGNTKVESAISNVTEITTSENDTLPLFYNFYSQEDMTTTGAYVNASLGSYLSGNVYTTAYNELVNKLGTGNVKANTDSFTDYDFVVNQDDMTFRLPLLNGNEDLTSEAIISTLGLPEKPTSTKSYYTAPYNGFINIIAYKSSTSNTFHVEINGVLVRQTRALSASNSEITVFVKKGDEIAVYTDSSSTGWTIGQQSFIKATGNGNLYYKVANALTNLELLDVAKVTADLNTCYKRNTGDNSDLSGLGMPSNKYIDLTLGASGSTYTAPANGWVTYEGSGNNVVAWLHLLSGSEATVTSGGASQSYANVYATIPVKKGDTFRLTYSTTTLYFRFVYAEGEV